MSFKACCLGNYRLVVYKGETAKPNNPIYLQDFCIAVIGENEVVLDNPIEIDDNSLWVGFVDVDKNAYPAAAIVNTASSNYGNYYSSASSSSWHQYDGVSWLINTYVTDGTYTYNLYRDDVKSLMP